jgi:hypothetical protein
MSFSSSSRISPLKRQTGGTPDSKRECTEGDKLKREAITDFAHGVLAHLTAHPDDLGTMQMQLKKLRTAIAEKEIHHADIGDVFENFCTLSSLDEGIIIDWVVGKSDLTKSDIYKARDFDGGALEQLLSHATDLPLHWKTPPALKNVQICLKFASARHDATGQKLHDFKSTGGLCAEGRLKDRVFKTTFDDDSGLLISFTHVHSKVTEDMPKGSHVTKEYSLENFCSDEDALFRLKPMKAVRVMSFFTLDDFKNTVGTNKRKQMDELASQIDMIAKGYADDVSRVQGAATAASAAAISEDIHKRDSVDRKKVMSAAREKALVKASEKQEKRTIKF